VLEGFPHLRAVKRIEAFWKIESRKSINKIANETHFPPCSPNEFKEKICHLTQTLKLLDAENQTKFNFLRYSMLDQKIMRIFTFWSSVKLKTIAEEENFDPQKIIFHWFPEKFNTSWELRQQFWQNLVASEIGKVHKEQHVQTEWETIQTILDVSKPKSTKRKLKRENTKTKPRPKKSKINQKENKDFFVNKEL
jgi:hypothetical protein